MTQRFLAVLICAAAIFFAPAKITRAADAPAGSASGTTLLLSQPSVSADRLAFVYGGDIWVSDRQGANPIRLTSQGGASRPKISPDGRMVAYSGTNDGNTDVYVIPIGGGTPKRLTFHPGIDEVNGWSVDGKRVLFASNREVANSRSNQFYEIAATGGYERKVMDAVAIEGAWSPDGSRLAYRPYRTAYEGTSGWRLYRGGETTPIRIIDPAAGKLEQVPHVNATDRAPIWLGDEIIFISDRDNVASNLFAYNVKSKELRQLTKETVWEVRSLGGYGTTAVFEVGGALKQVDLTSGAIKTLPISLASDTPQARPTWKNAASAMTRASLSPTGKRIVVTARGEIFTVPVKDGSIRNLTKSAGIRDHDGLWSPDGKQIAYITESKFQHFLALRDQAGLEPVKTYPLAKTGYFRLLAWSPDGKRLAVQDNHLTIYSLNLDKGDLTKIDASQRRADFNVSFSADGRFLAYNVEGENYFSRIRIYDFSIGKSYDVTDGLSDADDPTFGGSDYLYFTASTNAGPTHVGLDMSTQERAIRRGIYVAVLAADGKSPLLPKAGDEEAPKPDAKSADKPGDKDGKDADKTPKPAKATVIDFEGLQNRIISLGVAERRYGSLATAADGALFYLEIRQPGVSTEPGGTSENNAELYRYDFTERKAKSVKQGIENIAISGDRKKLLLISAKGKLEIADASEKLEPKAIELAQLGMAVDPRAEWRQIFDETWWMEKEFFYDPKMHGLDWDAVYARFSPLVNHVARRADLNNLLNEMIAEMQVGHNRIGGGDIQRDPPVAGGLLGADYVIENNRYRFKTIYRGDRWNPFLKAPLAIPGASAKEGDYLLSVNGQPLDGSQNIHALFENTVGKQTQLSLSSDPSGKGARTIIVEPIGSEAGLRQWAWIERNRDYVSKKTGGKVAYVYLPNTGEDGFKYFNRMFFAQVDKQAVIIDERRNGGGQAANYITEILGRPHLGGWKDRDGSVFTTPGGAILGPKVMLIDQDAGSGGDFLPYAFKQLNLGPLIGTRTWGGLIGISANPDLIDGGSLTVPFFRFFTPEGEWRIENEGVAPDIDVDLDAVGVNKGIDNQLDTAIAETLKRLAANPGPDRSKAPAMPTSLGK
jgi:tricorn protease